MWHFMKISQWHEFVWSVQICSDTRRPFVRIRLSLMIISKPYLRLYMCYGSNVHSGNFGQP